MGVYMVRGGGWAGKELLHGYIALSHIIVCRRQDYSKSSPSILPPTTLLCGLCIFRCGLTITLSSQSLML
jgi:hypothetical protein